ncbi:MAG: hypothetical protein ACD_60C00142G0005 [uncultured bacterium]|nr:MAG: hypothetical protein ACD_60C00142G0005 [uncultured bacterium]
MKLKTLVVASMSVLGLSLTSYPALAGTHHQHKHYTVQKQQTAAAQDYKGALPACPITDPYTATLDVMDQNVGRAKPTEDCYKAISFAGGINFDAKWGNRSMGYQGENVRTLSLNDAYLNVFGNVTDWSKAFASISYNNASGVNTASAKLGQYSNVYPTDTLTLEQGFIRIANFDQNPFFFQLGKQYQDFGRYYIHPIMRTMPQVLTETLRTSAELGFVTQMGLHGDVYAFDNPLRGRRGYAIATPAGASNALGHTQSNFGAALGFDHQMGDQLHWGVNLAYLYNMTGVNDIAQAVSQYQSGIAGSGTTTTSSTGGTYNRRVAAAAADAMIASGPFSLAADYASALDAFGNNDLGSRGTAAVAAGTGSGARPWAGNIQAGYGFNAWNKNQNVYLGYQASGDAVAVFLPKNRWLVGYNVDMWKNTNLGLEVAHDTDYSTSRGGTGDSSNTIGLRAGVKFG